MVSCAACGCSKTPKTTSMGITFHRFPKDDQKKKEWMKIVHRRDWHPISNSFLCSKHFTEESFDRTSNLKVKLLLSAIPSIQVARLKDMGSSTSAYIPRGSWIVAEATPSCTLLIEQEEPSQNRVVCSEMRSHSDPQDSPRTRKLKNTISELCRRDIIKSEKIRNLQKKVYRQRKVISLLKSIIAKLKKRNKTFAQEEIIFLNRLGENKRLTEISSSKSHGEKELCSDTVVAYLDFLNDHNYAIDV